MAYIKVFNEGIRYCDMIEVEAKVRVDSVTYMRGKIKQIARFEKKERKVDDYYTLQSLNSYPRKSLRVRKKSRYYEINFKQRISYSNGIHAKSEHEFILHDVQTFLDLIRDFGFRKWLRKEKYSEVYTLGKNFHIELNHVKNLGWFLEIEYLCQPSEIVHARKAVEDVIKKLGISRRLLVREGYTKMLWQK